MKQILVNIGNLFISPRFVSFYWRTAGMAIAELLNMIANGIADVGLPVWAVAILGLLIGEATKAVNNWVKGKDLGFAKK